MTPRNTIGCQATCRASSEFCLIAQGSIPTKLVQQLRQEWLGGGHPNGSPGPAGFCGQWPPAELGVGAQRSHGWLPGEASAELEPDANGASQGQKSNFPKKAVSFVAIRCYRATPLRCCQRGCELRTNCRLTCKPAKGSASDCLANQTNRARLPMLRGLRDTAGCTFALADVRRPKIHTCKSTQPNIFQMLCQIQSSTLTPRRTVEGQAEWRTSMRHQ